MGVRFTRTARFVPGKAQEAHEGLVRTAEHLREHYGLEVAWGYQWGGPTGVVQFWIDFDSMGHWEETSMSMVNDEVLGSLSAAAIGVYVDGGTDTIVRLE